MRETVAAVTDTSGWIGYAILSAAFAALTAILAKLGLEGIDSDYATLVRTAVIAVVLAILVIVLGKWRNPALFPLVPSSIWCCRGSQPVPAGSATFGH